MTLTDVSRVSGLSLITVSRALRRPETVRLATREKVHKAIDEIGYFPNLTARSLVSNRSNMIGVVVPILSSSLFADFAQGVARVLQKKGVQMLFGVSQRSVDLEAEAVKTFIARQADAIIL
ncbi:MAG: LacI family transcriptional regulator, partial [Alphaproteobacteria bacterium]|nr:LacI family transcriptional regulator [Alphaproteobacteria bacterium]